MQSTAKKLRVILKRNTIRQKNVEELALKAEAQYLQCTQKNAKLSKKN